MKGTNGCEKVDRMLLNLLVVDFGRSRNFSEVSE
jgi:hypothetical protein